MVGDKLNEALMDTILKTAFTEELEESIVAEDSEHVFSGRYEKAKERQLKALRQRERQQIHIYHRIITRYL